MASLSVNGTLPAGITFTDNGDGTGTLAGTATQGGDFPLTVVGHNGIGADATQSLDLTVTQNVPPVTWAPPAAIVYGAPLSATQLDATSPVAGTFTYAPPRGTVLHAGVQTLSATFTPIDTVHYSTVTTTVPLTVNQATPHITWVKPRSILYGTPIGASQLRATASTAGSFAYGTPLGTVFHAGSHTLSATFTPTDAVDFAPASATRVLLVKVTRTTAKLAMTTSVTFANQSAADFVVTVTPRSGSIPASGQVTVLTGTTVLCTATLDAAGVGRCTLSSGQVSVGRHRISATFAGTADLKASKTRGSAFLTVT